MDGFAFQTISALSAGLDAKAFSPVELLDDTLSRLSRLEPILNCLAFLDVDGAQRDAKAATERQTSGTRLSALDGIPTSIKDLIAQRGLPQRFGSRTTTDAPVPADAPSVVRLRSAGAVLLGKSTTSEYGCKAVGDSPLTGVTRNPWNTDLTPGGSSCGAAAMVAAGIVPYAIGTDGGGSLRIPAALTGTFGIKGNFGRVPVYPVSATPTLAHVGPLARTVADAALVLQTMSGFDARDPFSIAGEVPSFVTRTVPGRPLRIAYSATLGYAKPTKPVLDLANTAARAIDGLGHRVELVDHVLDDPLDLWRAEFYAGAGTRLNAVMQSAPELIDPDVLTMLRPALSQEMMDYYAKVFARYALRERMRVFFEDYDLLISPTLPCTAFAVGRNAPEYWPEDDPIGWVAYTYPFNLSGQPAASICAGFSADGLPVGLQVVGRNHDEGSVLALCAHYEAAHVDLGKRPPLTT